MYRNVIVLLQALTLAAAAPAAPSRCDPLYVLPRLMTDSGTYVVATATADTLRDVVDHGFGSAVFGQVYTIDSVEGRNPTGVRRAQRAVLVWWGLAPDCRRAPPRASRMLPPGASLFTEAVVRDSSQWIAGLPTYDVDFMHWPYAPALSDAANPLTVQQFADLLRSLPRIDRPGFDYALAARQILAWARRNPDLAARVPAADQVRGARAVLDGKWPSR